VTLPVRSMQLKRLAVSLQEFDQDALWVARWSPYLGYVGVDPHLLAAAIDGGGAEGDAVFDALIASSEGTDEIGTMGRHVVGALLSAGRPDGWDHVESLLLAAQRQEGLRQVILEAMDLANPDAFRRLLSTIVDNGLTRFSATVRALDVWLGLGLMADQRAADRCISGVIRYLDDEPARVAGIATGTAEEAYLAMWATAYADAPPLVATAAAILHDTDVERRYAAVHILTQMGLTTANHAVVAALDDPDVRVAARSMIHIASSQPGRGFPEDTFERIERFLSRMPGKRMELRPILWPWTGGALKREDVAHALLTHRGDRSPARLIPHLSSMDGYRRGEAAKLLAKTSGTEMRTTLFALVVDPSPLVRRVAIEAARSLVIDDEDIPPLERALTRKAGDLRRGVEQLLLGLPDEDVLASADRLVASKNAEQRMAGLELLRRLIDGGRSADAARARGDAYRDARGGLTPREEVQLTGIDERGSVHVTLDDALGLLDPTKQTPAVQPVRRDVDLVTTQAVALMAALDEEVHRLRDVPVTIRTWRGEQTELFGDVRHGIPGPGFLRPKSTGPTGPEGLRAEAAEHLPLFEQWEEWSRTVRGGDSNDLLRALCLIRALSLTHRNAGVHPAAEELLGKVKAPAPLRYGVVVHSVLEWLTPLEATNDDAVFALAAAEDTLARLTPAAARWKPDTPMFGMTSTWRASPWVGYLHLARMLRRARPELWGRDEQARLWGLERWVYAPTFIEEVPRRRGLRDLLKTDREPAGTIGRARPPFLEVVAAFQAGAATEADLVDHLLGPRDRGPAFAYGSSFNFDDLGQLTRRTPAPLLGEVPVLAEIVDRCRTRILDVELARGEHSTPASPAALSLKYTGGLDVLSRLMTAAGSMPFTRGWSYDGEGRQVVFSRLIRGTFPSSDDTPEAFADALGSLKPKRLVELGCFAPHWARHVERATGWAGLASGIWWMHAHTKSDDWRVDQEIRETWIAEVTERTSLSSTDLLEGAVDVGWFGRVYEELGPERWKVLDSAAKYCSAGGGHKRAQLFADAIRGAATEAPLLERMMVKRHQDAVRAFGLIPLTDGEPVDDQILRRYQQIEEFRRTSRQFGSMRQASEKRAVEIGLANLARSAGFRDPLRLAWAMEARGVADLADGPLTAREGDVEVALSVDLRGQPEISIRRGDKILKSVPAEARKSKEVKALRARATDLRRQVSRMRRSLEGSMIRGDAFSGEELRGFAQHPLLWPMVSRLVLVGDGVAGYPGEDGAVLTDHAGAMRAIGTTDELRIAHPVDLLALGDWHRWQQDCLMREVIQPFKQVFRELYVPTKAELGSGSFSSRYAGHQIQPGQALALLGGRGWLAHPEEGVRRVYHDERLIVVLSWLMAFGTPAEVEAPTFEDVNFFSLDRVEGLPIAEVPPRVFSETMRDLDLVVSVAHAGGVDPEASASTIEMRAALVEETASLLKLGNVRIDKQWVLIDGTLGEYSVHLGSGVVHRRPGGSVCIVPVSGQHRGRVFLPFADDDPRTAEVVAKVLLLAKDHEIKDPTILEQIRG
jgi:HEAT repeat protein